MMRDELRQALATYTEAGGTGKTAIHQAEAVALMQEKYEVCYGLFGSYTTPAAMVRSLDRSHWTTGTPADRLRLLPAAQEHVLAQEDGKNRLVRAVTELSQTFALAVRHEAALAIRDDVGFVQAVRVQLAKGSPDERKSNEDLDHAIRQIVSKAMAAGEVVRRSRSDMPTSSL